MHRPRKRFGQNFLIDSCIIEKIIQVFNLSAASAFQGNYKLIEIGPGQGALTEPLLHLDIPLTVVEIDRDLVENLETKYSHRSNLNIICADALRFDFQSLYDPTKPETKLKIIGNLPYNISTPLLFHLFSYNKYIQDMYFMLQKEVVDRMTAHPHSKDYGRLSIMTQYFCDAQCLFTVPPSAFFPPPRVQSAIVRLIPHNKFSQFSHSASFYSLFDTLVKSAFSKRRKTLSNALKEIISKEALEQLGIDPLSRAENLDIEQYLQISHFLNNLRDENDENSKSNQ